MANQTETMNKDTLIIHSSKARNLAERIQDELLAIERAGGGDFVALTQLADNLQMECHDLDRAVHSMPAQ